MNDRAMRWLRPDPKTSRSSTRRIGGALGLSLLILIGAPQFTAVHGAEPQPWVSTWATSPQSGGGGAAIDGQTIRQRMRVSIGGDQIRVHFSNAFGKAPLVIGHATIGVPTDPASVKAGSLKELTFGGKPSVTIPPGAPAVSDPVTMNVPVGSLVSVSMFLPEKLDPAAYTVHSLGLRTAIISPKGDFASAPTVEQAAKSDSIYFVMGLSVPKKGDQFTIVAFGDSITDGTNSTVEADASWPANFARRLAAAGKGNKIAIVNQGIGGNQLRRDFAGVSAQARFDRDALTIPGVKYIVVLEGINDLGFPGAKMGGRLLARVDEMPTADDIIAAYQQLIARAHLHGIKIYGATLTPFKGTDLPGYYEESKEPVREKINAWIRTSGAFDAVIDFDAVLRDSADPHRAATALISPRDHLHPSDAGYKKMADSIDLSLFK